MGAIEFRPLARNDGADLAAFAYQSWHATYDDIVPAGQVDYMLAERMSAETLEQLLSDQNARCEIGWAGGVIRAYIVVFRRQDDSGEISAYLQQIYCHPVHTGCGSIALSRVWEIARQWEATWVNLTVNRGNERAVRFYRARGFSITHEQVTDIGHGYVMDDYAMSCRVPAPDASSHSASLDDREGPV